LLAIVDLLCPPALRAGGVRRDPGRYRQPRTATTLLIAAFRDKVAFVTVVSGAHRRRRGA